MSRKLPPLSIAATLLSGAAHAEVPKVAVDIAPVHSLVAIVMEGVGTPSLIVPPGASPHEYNLRPSQAAALQEADLVFWLGEDLTPWMEGAMDTLTDDATVTSLLEADGTILLEFREGALFEAHAHEDEHEQGHEGEHDHEDEHEHDDHSKEDGHEDHADGDDHDHDAHDHEGHDPHAWLSPDNAKTWLDIFAAQLSTVDPDNAETYLANAAAGRTEMDAHTAEVAEMLDPVRGSKFVVFHDAYQYFETAFDFPASGAISLGDASDPSPARIAEIQGRIREEGVECVLTEPQFNPGLVDTVLSGVDAKTGVIDPIGSDLEPGPDLYPQIIKGMASTLSECLEH
ncbi:zinc ABC transporter substrate-binding protein [Rhodobacteraceae bacterium B1Z28]|uniref:High-affinity zinc uptake system protein ZnuA n=1 Tax=Ruegeria haliotis TaxID=2747601 RepID=A0ABX2PJA8_9RHOB|nr:zinc ABC transporter substrate-binding protein [Ruegeria haliotis]NVO54190.1 zinc ABC transporter substrate-binding protein [Ruegeria haliotis]